MSNDFLVNNPGLQEANDSLNREVGQLGIILDDLNRVLQNMGVATQNRGVPLWADLQSTWNGQYLDMTTRLNAGYNSSVGAHEEYYAGDQQSVRIMS